MAKIKRIGIYGVGGHGKVVAQIAAACGYTETIWIDDACVEGTSTFEAFLDAYPDTPVALGIGGNKARQRVCEKIEATGIMPAVLVHPTASVAPDAVVGAGSVVMPMAVVNTEAVIGKGGIVNSGAVIEHECRLDDFVHISPKAALAGAIRVGARTHVGIGSSVIQCITIGSDCIIAAGAAVISPLPDGVMAAGVPAVIKKELN
jgi:UDP-N-acetylbacillosamine N-acetyltransferase